MKTKVLLDMDGVIADFYTSFAKHLNNRLGSNIDISVEPSVYSLHDWDHGLPNTLVNKEIPAWMIAGGYKDMPIYAGAKSFVYQLLDRYDVHIVTARIGDFKMNLPDTLKSLIRRDTDTWFRAHAIPADKLFFEHEKVAFCKENGINIVIEDKLSTVVSATQAGLTAILINRGWNQWESDTINRDYSNLHVARNHQHILDILEDLS